MRGQVWWADLNPTRGTVQAGRRLVVVVQTDRANRSSPHTIVVPCSTRIRRPLLPSHVHIAADTARLTQDSVVLCEQVRVVDQARLERLMGQVPKEAMDQIDAALKVILELT